MIELTKAKWYWQILLTVAPMLLVFYAGFAALSVFDKFFAPTRDELIDGSTFPSRKMSIDPQQVRDLQVFLAGLIEQRFDIPKKDLELRGLSAEISEFRGRIDQIAESTLALRQAINPKNPEEILTIARLTDQLQSVERKIEKLDDELAKRHIAFTRGVTRELDATSRATNLLMVALIPLVLNLAYQIWKDRRMPKKADGA